MTQPPNPEPSRATVLDRIYRKISQLDDAALAQLDRTITEIDAAADDLPVEGQKQSRRGFLLLLIASIVTAGGSAAYLLSQQGIPPAPAVSGGTVTKRATTSGQLSTPAGTPLPPATTGPDLSEQLAAVRAERIALRVQLDAARDDLNSTNANLQARNDDVAYLEQVVGLYQDLEDVGLDATVTQGFDPVETQLDDLETRRALLSDGITQAAALLATIEVQSPEIANGLLWLESQINALAQLLQRLEDALSALFEPVVPIVQQVGDFINQVLDLLPFGVGENIKAALETIGTILTHIPELVSSINPLVITPLRQWVSPDDTKGLVAEVVQPISSNLISPAQSVADHLTLLGQAYERQLKRPVEQSITQRAAIRQRLLTLTGVS